MAVYFKVYAKFGAFNRAARFNSALYHYKHTTGVGHDDAERLIAKGRTLAL
jgi:hypothetical protein